MVRVHRIHSLKILEKASILVRTMVSAKIMVHQVLMEQTAVVPQTLVEAEQFLLLVELELTEAMVGAMGQVILQEPPWDMETVTVVLMDTDCHLEFRMESPMDKVPALVQVCRTAIVSVIMLAMVHRKVTEPV